MLTPKQLDNLPQRMIEIYSEVEMDIIADMASRISANKNFIPAAEWQYKKLIEMGAFHDEIIKKLAETSKIGKKELTQLMKEAGVEAIKTDSAIYKKAGLFPPVLNASPEMLLVLSAGIQTSNGMFENLMRTTANTATKQFEDALDRVWLQINSGAFSPDEAIKMAVMDLASKGLASVTYPSGKTDYLETAVRRATVTGINQTALKMQETLADEMETDLVEVTAHSGARTGEGVANHAEWQGKIYSRSGTHPKYPSLRERTGYGTGEGLGGYNCRHSMFPFIDGISEPVYTQAELEELNAPKFEYNGQKLTEYETLQKQRHIERNIRKYKREFNAMEAAGLPTDESASLLSKWQAIEKDFISQTGLKKQYAREWVNGFGRSEAQKAINENKLLESIKKDAIIKKSSGLPKKVVAEDEALKSTVDVDLPTVKGVVPKGINLTNVYIMAGQGTSVPIKDLRRLTTLYGGSIQGWQKKSGNAKGEKFRYVVHWYENGSISPAEEFKLKGVNENEG